MFELFYVTQFQCCCFSKLIPQQLSMNFNKINALIYTTTSYKCSWIY